MEARRPETHKDEEPGLPLWLGEGGGQHAGSQVLLRAGRREVNGFWLSGVRQDRNGEPACGWFSHVLAWRVRMGGPAAGRRPGAERSFCAEGINTATDRRGSRRLRR